MARGLELITHNWTLKLAALGLAILLWSVTRADAPEPVPVQRIPFDVPVEVALRDPNWVLARPPAPRSVTVTIAGPSDELVQVYLNPPELVVPVDNVDAAAGTWEIDPSWIRLRGGASRVQVEDVRPTAVQLFFERLASRLVPLRTATTGALAEGHELTGPIFVEPAVVRASGPASAVEGIARLRTEPIAIDGLRDTTSVRVAVDTAGLEDVIISPLEAQVTIPVAPVPADTMPPDEPGADTVPPDTVLADAPFPAPAR